MTKQEAIHAKGFSMADSPTEYGKIKVGVHTLDDATLNLGSIQKESRNLISKGVIYRALMDNDTAKLRELSNYFYKTSGIYQKVCNYFASMYRYDWYITPYIIDIDKEKEFKTNLRFKAGRSVSKLWLILSHTHLLSTYYQPGSAQGAEETDGPGRFSVMGHIT